MHQKPLFVSKFRKLLESTLKVRRKKEQEKLPSNTRFYDSGQKATPNKFQCDFGKTKTHIGKRKK